MVEELITCYRGGWLRCSKPPLASAKVGFKRLAIHHANGALIFPNHFVSGIVGRWALLFVLPTLHLRPRPHKIPGDNNLSRASCVLPARSNYTVIRNSYYLFVLLIVLLAAGCEREFGGTRLFTVTYPVLEFGIPAGQTGTFFIAQDRVQTGFFDALRDNMVAADEVDLVGGFRARLTSISGEDLGEIERIDLRACPVGTPNGCTDITFNLFSLSDNFNRRQQQINLNPTPVNARDLFLGSDDFRFEIVIFPGQTTSVPIDVRLEWEVQAVGDLD